MSLFSKMSCNDDAGLEGLPEDLKAAIRSLRKKQEEANEFLKKHRGEKNQ